MCFWVNAALTQTFKCVLFDGITSGVKVISPKQIWRYPTRGLTVDKHLFRADVNRIFVIESSQNLQTWIPAYDLYSHLHSPTKVRADFSTSDTAS